MLIVALAQILTAFNVNAFRISVGGIVASFETSRALSARRSSGLAGARAAALVPTLVVLIAANFQGRRRVQAIGWLGASEAVGGRAGR
jgi:hypothetical protein